VLLAALAVVAVGKFNKSQAADWAIATIGSQHLGGGDFCEHNPGFGIETGEASRTMVGVYRNSLREDDRGCDSWSVYLGKSWMAFKYGKWSLGGAGMVITGYESAITLGLAAVISYEERDWGWNLVWFPSKDGDFSQGVIGLQLRRRF
jgi:hypothetical protein